MFITTVVACHQLTDASDPLPMEARDSTRAQMNRAKVGIHCERNIGDYRSTCSQVESGLKTDMSFAMLAVSGPRSFWTMTES